MTESVCPRSGESCICCHQDDLAWQQEGRIPPIPTRIKDPEARATLQNARRVAAKIITPEHMVPGCLQRPQAYT